MRQIAKMDKGSNSYTIIIALLPILSLYKDIFNLAEIGTILLLISGVLLLLTNLGQIMKKKCPGYGWLVLFLIDAILSIFIWGHYDSATYRTAVLTVLIMAFCVLVHVGYSNTKVFSVRRASSVVQIVSLIAAVLVLVQYITHYLFGFYANFMIKPLLLDYIQYDYMSFMLTGISIEGMFRPSAFFLEPSHMSLYCLIGVVTLLFNNISNKNSIKKAAIISIGIMFTTSGIGIFFIIVVWTMWLFKHKDGQNRGQFVSRLMNILIGVFSLAILFILLLQVPIFLDAYYRVFSGSLGSSAIFPRIYNLLLFFEEDKSLQIIGNGFLTYPDSYYKYYNGAIKMLYGQGYIGLGLFIAFLWARFRRSDICGKILIVMLAGLFVVAEMYSTIYLCYYLMFICADEKYITCRAV